ncbi:MAG: hypothetical protein WBD58_20700 [Geitlerinemataceae cyanobacterium]
MSKSQKLLKFEALLTTLCLGWVKIDCEEAIAIDRIWQRLQKLWRVFLGEEPEALVETRWHYQLQQSAFALDLVLQQLNLQPGRDYSIRISPTAVGVSIHSSQAAAAVKTHPAARVAFDRFMGHLGAVEGRSGQPCRFPKHPNYAQNWKKMK